MKKSLYLCLILFSSSFTLAKTISENEGKIVLNQDEIFVVKNINGDISIEGSDISEAQWSIDKRDFGSHCYVNLDNEETSGFTLQIKKTLLSFFKHDTNCLADIKLSLPKKANVYLETEKGNISIKNIEGRIALEANKGKVMLENITSSSLLSTLAHGNLFIKNSTLNAADINLGSGSIEASLIAGPDQKVINIQSGMSDVFIYLDNQTGGAVHFESGMGELLDERTNMLPSLTTIPFQVSLGMGSMFIREKD